MNLQHSPMAEGKRSFLQAALRLARTNRSISAIGIRELAREAGLNPNTFYKHFADMDELGLALVSTLEHSLRQPIRGLRHQAAVQSSEVMRNITADSNIWLLSLQRAGRVVSETIRLLFDFVAQEPEAFTLAVRELHGASPAMRKAMREFIASCGADLAADIRSLQLVPLLDDDSIDGLADTIVQQLMMIAVDYLDQPEQREQLLGKAQDFIYVLVIGTLLLQDMDPALREMIVQACKQIRVDMKRTHYFSSRLKAAVRQGGSAAEDR